MSQKKYPTPKRFEAWLCEMCGKVHETKQQAEACSRRHIRAGEMKISGINMPDGQAYVYEQGRHFPVEIRVTCGRTRQEVVYRRVGASADAGRAKMAPVHILPR